MVDGATLEMLCTATYRRFESCPLRQNLKIPHFMRDFLCFGEEDRDEEVPCGSRVGSADIRRGCKIYSILVEKFRILCYNVESNYWRMP